MAREVRHVYVKVSSNVGTTLPKATAQSEGLRRSLQGVATSAGAATGGVRGLAGALMSSGIGAAAIAIGSIVALFGKAASTSKDFAAEVSKLGAISGATGQDLKDLERDALRLGSTTEWTASQVVALQIEYSKLGFTKEEILNVTEATLSLASATGVELAEAASIGGNMLRAFGLSANETQRVADVLTKTVVTSATSMDTLRESMKMVAPTAKNLKVSLEETAAMVALLGDRGIKGTMAGTALRKIFMELAKSTGKDVPTALKMVSEQLKNATSDTEKLKIATDLVGVRFAAQLQMLAENVESMDEYAESLRNAGGTAQEIAEKRLDNLNGDLIKLSSAWEGLLLTISESDGAIQRGLRGITQFFTQIVNYMKLQIDIAGYNWDFMWENMSMTMLNAKETFKYNFQLIFKRIQLFALNAKEALADVPLIGAAVDKEKLAADREQLFAELRNIEGMVQTTNKRKLDMQNKYAKGLAQVYIDFAGEVQRQTTDAITSMTEDFIEGTEEGLDEAGETAAAKAAKFLAKILKMEEDFADKSKTDKLIRERNRLLEEMDQLELSETQKGELRLQIHKLYAQKISDANSESFANEAAEAEKELEKRKAAEEEYHRTKTQLQYQALDSMSQIFGEETAMAKAIHLLKTGLMIQEMILSAKKQMAEAAGDQAEVVQDGVGANTKALKTLNPLIIAATAISVGAAIVSGVKAMKKRKEAASKLASVGGGSVSSAASAPASPDFNIIGQLSAGESLIASTVAEANAKPVKAYVVEGEIESVRQANATAKKVASV